MYFPIPRSHLQAIVLELFVHFAILSHHPKVTSLETAAAVIAKRMLTLAKSPNKLQQEVIENKWDKKRAIWKTMDETEMPDLPQLNEPELRDLTMGVY